MKILTTEQVIAIHDKLIFETGGTTGVRDIGLLESALASPFQTFNGQPFYPSIQQKASRLCYGIIQNHPFIDGNKRIGIHMTLIFLAVNGISLVYTQQELITLGLGIARGNVKHDEILKWIILHQKQ